MTTGAIIFMALSWLFVLGLVTWAFRRILSGPGQQHFDPDGIGPAEPPVAGRADPGSGRRPPPR